jgi:DNA sulfur modification protein DndC
MTLAEKIKEITSDIQTLYLQDSTPWILGYSGGKDSTAVLQLVFYALAKLPKEQLTKEIHVLSNDTLVENPAVVNYIDQQLELIEKVGKEKVYNHLPNHFFVTKVVPKIEDRFWINLIGKGYPAPNRWFRWCTERMKINPANDYILKTVSRHGKTMVVLGTRKAESSNRAKSMEKYDLKEITGGKIRKHSLPNSWMYAPIMDLTTDEVWKYLIQVPNFWGGDNKVLVSMYRNASENAAECPLVIDTSTSSCGNSRFGCWVCTVVTRDKSMENLIDNGEDWMLPLLEFRDYLNDLRDAPGARMPINRLGQDKIGPFEFHTRAELLRRVLTIEEETGLEVISRPELAAIQLQWNYDGGFEYRVSDIYYQVKKKHIVMTDNQKQLQREEEEYALLKEVAQENGVDPNHIRELLVTEKEYVTYLRRRNIYDDILKKVEYFVKKAEIEQKEPVV